MLVTAGEREGYKAQSPYTAEHGRWRLAAAVQRNGRNAIDARADVAQDICMCERVHSRTANGVARPFLA
ncbi:hypothetical protein ABIA40_000251 [Bradyrhizobium sp. USDA 223]